MSEKRNSRAGTAQLDLFGLPPSASSARPSSGVGARQAAGAVSSRGGEYLEMCGLQNFGPEFPHSDPRFAELETLGLPRPWMVVAETVGFDLWLEVWRRLSADERLLHDGGQRMPKLRSYESYLRFQRNRYIEALAARGLSVPQVARAVARNLREPLDEKHVAKIMRRR